MARENDRSHKSPRPHKSRKAEKLHNTRKSKRDASVSPSTIERKLQSLTVGQFDALVALLKHSAPQSAQKQATKTRHDEPFAKEAKDSKVRKPSKTPKTVSVAGIFKRNSHHPPQKKVIKVREKTPDPDLVIDFQNGLETAYATIQAKSKASFDSIHAQFTKRIKTARVRDVELISFVSNAAEKLSLPLVNEQVEIEMEKHGKRVSETVNIGERVHSFKIFIEKEEMNLTELWRQWEEIQDEYKELGVEVFGAKEFDANATRDLERDGGFRKEIEANDLEHDATVEELNEEIEEMGANILRRMKNSEKELDNAMKKDQEALFRALLFA